MNYYYKCNLHNCREIIAVHEGRLKDLVKGDEVGRLDFMIIPANQMHHVVAKEDSSFYVDFKKPK